MASPFSWPVLVPSALRAPAPVNLGVMHQGIVMPIIKFLSVVALFGSIAWMVATPDYEPAIAIIASLSTLIANFIVEKRKDSSLNQRQEITGNGVGIQAGGDVTVGNIRNSSETKSNVK